MNGYQFYLKRMPDLIPYEVLASQKLGFNLGIKFIRGAYMNEERELAEQEGVPSPVWDSITETHASYNGALEHVLPQMKPNDHVVIASHNVDSVELVK